MNKILKNRQILLETDCNKENVPEVDLCPKKRKLAAEEQDENVPNLGKNKKIDPSTSSNDTNRNLTFKSNEIKINIAAEEASQTFGDEKSTVKSQNSENEQEKPRGELVKRILYAVFIVLMTTRATAGTQFSSHVTVNTPSLSFTHGVGDPLNAYGRRTLQRQAQRTSHKKQRRPNMLSKSYSHLGDGYILSKPLIPFSNEDIRHDVTTKSSLWFQNDHMQDLDLPLLPPSPYKVDSDDPESLWPEGLFLPPLRPPRFEFIDRRADTADQDAIDPYLLEGTEAIAALEKAKVQGHVFFDDFPHIASLLANQDLRIKNKLKPHRIASIRHTWPFNRP